MSDTSRVISRGNVAVVTGAASGIGRALAGRAADAGMRVVLADIDDVRLRAVEAELGERGADVLPVVCDTTSEAAVNDAVQAALDRFGAVHLMCNNAGIAGAGDAWRGSIELWRRVVDINLLGVVHGIRAVLPIMEEQGVGHIVNTASMAGLIPLPGAAPYTATKHAVVALSEALHLELAATGSPVGVSVLCPGFVKTALMDREPAGASAAPPPAIGSRAIAAMITDVLRDGVDAGIPADDVAAAVVAAVDERRFWILTHADMRELPVERMQRAAAQANPPAPGQD